jgi:hypothetical protein
MSLAATAESSAVATRLYDNTGNPANTYYSAQGGAEAIDDLHLGAGGTLDSVAFEYFDPATGGTFSATVNLYANPGGMDLATLPLAGPYTIGALPRGRRAVAIALPGLAIESSLWVGVRFTSSTAGLVIKSTPSVGSSHDYYLENGNFYWFGGDPRANFGLRLVGTSAAVSVDEGTTLDRAALSPPRPNPFRAGATIAYAIPRRGTVSLVVLDVSGRRVRSLVAAVQGAGRHAETWSGRDDAGRLVKAGLYLVRLETAQGSVTRKLVFAP